MSHSDFIPKPNAKFDAWQDNMMTELSGKATSFGIRPEEVAPLTTKQGRWKVAYIATEGVKNCSAADILARNEARGDYEPSIRTFKKRFLTENPKVSDADLERMGFPVPKKTRTPVKKPGSATVLSVDFSHHLRHLIHFRDAEASGKAKPDGVVGCEIWRKVGGDPPVNASELTFLGLDTRSPFLVEYLGEQVGQPVYYWGRWVNTRGEYGPWSEPVTAIIA